MKYCFEKYEISNKGQTFLGYATASGDSAEEAREKILSKAGENIILAQIYLPQEL